MPLTAKAPVRDDADRMESDLTRYWVILAVCILISAFFSASETALVSLGKVRLRRLKELHPHLGPVVEQLANKPDRLLSTILLGSNLSNSAASSSATAIAIALFPAHPILVATCAVTVLLLVFTDITPKVVAASQAERISLLVAQPLNLLSRLASPLVQLLTLGPRLVLKLFGITAGQPETTSDDNKTIAVLGREEGILGPDETEIIHSAVEFGGITVGGDPGAPRRHPGGGRHDPARGGARQGGGDRPLPHPRVSRVARRHRRHPLRPRPARGVAQQGALRAQGPRAPAPLRLPSTRR